MGVADLHVARHHLDEPHEVLQFRSDVVAASDVDEQIAFEDGASLEHLSRSDRINGLCLLFFLTHFGTRAFARDAVHALAPVADEARRALLHALAVVDDEALGVAALGVGDVGAEVAVHAAPALEAVGVGRAAGHADAGVVVVAAGHAGRGVVGRAAAAQALGVAALMGLRTRPLPARAGAHFLAAVCRPAAVAVLVVDGRLLTQRLLLHRPWAQVPTLLGGLFPTM